LYRYGTEVELQRTTGVFVRCWKG